MWYYFYPNSLFSGELSVCLDNDRLELCRVVARSTSTPFLSIPLEEITMIKLSWEEVGRNGDKNYYCEVIGKMSKQKIRFYSGMTKEHYYRYVAFVNHLHNSSLTYKNITYVLYEPYRNFVKFVIVVSTIFSFIILPLYIIVLLCIAGIFYYSKYHENQTYPYNPKYIPPQFLPH